MSTVQTPEHETSEPAWSLGTALLFVVLWLGIQMATLLFFSFAAVAVTMMNDGVSAEDAALRLQNAPVTIGQLAASVGLTALSWIATFALLRRMLRRWRPDAVRKSLGLIAPTPAWSWALAPFIAIGLLVAGNVITWLLNVNEDTSIARLLQTPSGAVAIVILAVAIAPPAEEIFFRGFVLPPMARRFSLGSALAFNGLVFALVHIQTYLGEFGYLPPLFLFGFVLSGLRLWTGSVLPGILVHAIFNAASIAAFLLSRPETPAP